VPAVQGIGRWLAFVAGVMLVTTSVIFEAMAQPVGDVGEPPETVPTRAGRSEANLETKAVIKIRGAAGRRVPCDQVISQVDREGYVHGRRGVEMAVVAKNLNTSVVWVERCMLAYGREPERPSGASAESRERRLESLEEGEAEERGPEEIEEPASGRHELREKQPRRAAEATPGS
jgi:hypothetical protein